MVERRSHPRVRRRLAVRFGDGDLARAGFTADVSEGGMFILTDGRAPTSGRIHLQIFLDKDLYILTEAMALREKVVPAELKSVAKGGFAVRFLSTAELLRPAISGVETAAPAGEIPKPGAPPLDIERPSAERAAAPARLTSTSPTAVAAASAPVIGSPVRMTSSQPAVGGGAKLTTSGRWVMATGKPTDPFVIELRSIEDLRQALAGDLRNGRVFIPTPIALPVNAVVHTELRIAFAGQAFQRTARVAPSESGSKGMRLVLDDGRGLAAELETLLPR